jgi:thymidylate synthase (FAD)
VGAKVHLLSHTPDPEGVIARATRLCYSPLGIEELNDVLDDEARPRLLRKVMSLGHHSVLEHATFTFGIEGVSRAMTHQLVRHPMASYSQKSQRYVEFTEALPVVVPESIATDDSMARLFEEQCSRSFALYREMCQAGMPGHVTGYRSKGNPVEIA